MMSPLTFVLICSIDGNHGIVVDGAHIVLKLLAPYLIVKYLHIQMEESAILITCNLPLFCKLE